MTMLEILVLMLMMLEKGGKLTSEVLGGMWNPRGNKKGLSR